MAGVEPNLDKSGKTTRIVIGVMLLVGAFLDFGWFYLLLLGLLFLVEGIMGWCFIPKLAQKLGLEK